MGRGARASKGRRGPATKGHDRIQADSHPGPGSQSTGSLTHTQACPDQLARGTNLPLA